MQYTIQHNKFMAQNAANAIKCTKKRVERKIGGGNEREKTVMMPRSLGIYRMSKKLGASHTKNETFQLRLESKSVMIFFTGAWAFDVITQRDLSQQQRRQR